MVVVTVGYYYVFNMYFFFFYEIRDVLKVFADIDDKPFKCIFIIYKIGVYL